MMSDGRGLRNATVTLTDSNGNVRSVLTGSLGYYSDGHEHVAAAMLSASGRRLFLEYDGDAVSTNVQPYIFDWRPLPSPELR